MSLTVILFFIRNPLLEEEELRPIHELENVVEHQIFYSQNDISF